MKISANVREQVLLSKGASPDEFRVDVVPNSSLGGSPSRSILGKIASAIESCFGKRTPFAISLYAELSKYKSSIVIVKRDKFQEKIQMALGYLPYAGIALGLIPGLLSRDSLFYSSKINCKNGFSDSPFLQSIHLAKQWEIKNIAYFTPFILPAYVHWKKHFNRIEWGFFKDKVVQIFTTIQEKQKDELVSGRFCLKAIEAVFKTFTNRIVYTGSLLVFGMGTPIYTLASRLLFRGFDPSGHFLLKTVSAALLTEELTALSKTASRRGQLALLGYASLYALTDAVLLYNTASFCHTAPEVICGLAAGIGLVKVAKHFHNETNLSNPLEE